MQFRTLGKTGKRVSAIGLGALKLGNLSQKEADRLIAQALDGGINYIDTACTYGDSEPLLGRALQPHPRQSVLLSSKCIHRELSKFQEGFAASLDRLRTDYIDIYYVHDVSTRENWSRVRDGGILDFLLKQKRRGAVLHIGCSTHDCEIGVEMLKTGLFEVCMLAYNSSNTTADEALLPAAREAGCGVVVMKPFGGGILTLERSRQMGFETTAEESLRFCLAAEGVHTVIPGLDRPDYLQTALAAGADPAPMTEAEKEALQAKITIRGKAYCRGCGYCLPCPAGIPIPEILQLYNRWEMIERVDWSRKHQLAREYTERIPRGVSAERCTGCGACARRCPYNLPVPALMERVSGTMNRYD